MTRRDVAQAATVLAAVVVLVLTLGFVGWVETGGAW